MPGIKSKVKIKKIPEGPRRSDLGATFRVGGKGGTKSRSKTTYGKKAGGSVIKKAGGGKMSRRKKPMRIKKIRAGDIDPRLSSTFNPGGSRYGGIDPTRKMGRQEGGSLKEVPSDKKGLAKLPKKVRGKMGYKKAGGMVKKMGGGQIYNRGKGGKVIKSSNNGDQVVAGCYD